MDLAVCRRLDSRLFSMSSILCCSLAFYCSSMALARLSSILLYFLATTIDLNQLSRRYCSIKASSRLICLYLP